MSVPLSTADRELIQESLDFYKSVRDPASPNYCKSDAFSHGVLRGFAVRLAEEYFRLDAEVEQLAKDRFYEQMRAEKLEHALNECLGK